MIKSMFVFKKDKNKHMINSKTIILSIIFLLALGASPLCAEEPTQEVRAGSLNVYSKIGFLKVYVDNDFVGETPVEIEQIRIGTHLVTATKKYKTVYEQIVSIREGEVTTVMVSGKKPKEKPPSKYTQEEIEEPKKKAQPSFQALYAKIGYMSSYNYSYSAYVSDSYYASSLAYGIGYKLSLSPYVGVLFDISRADFSSPDASWYMIPLTVSLQMGYPMARGFEGLYYYSIGLGYYMTNLKYQGNNLSSVGYNMATGLEFPVGEEGSVFLETSYSIAENTKAEFALDSLVVAFGYRMTI